MRSSGLFIFPWTKGFFRGRSPPPQPVEKGQVFMANEDAATTRMVRGQIARRYIDASLLDIRVTHGVVYFRRVIRRLRTHADMDLVKEMEIISTILRQKSGIRDVIWEITQRA